ncbi:hypothetical protein TIFTF001_004877 [Ficus carica]|uniref:Uncharacterized protein n=1 Tax=Ficus carica TaxID=3494 RepID=A0AA87ZK26_FICCA|nr:hypothetical protein TIFTF001_004877 [Ficus carica]
MRNVTDMGKAPPTGNPRPLSRFYLSEDGNGDEDDFGGGDGDGKAFPGPAPSPLPTLYESQTSLALSSKKVFLHSLQRLSKFREW